MRTTININKNWRFTQEKILNAENVELDDSKWEKVSIPHCWNSEDGQKGDYFREACWYRKNLNLGKIKDLNSKRVFVEFEGSSVVTDVYLNEHYVGQHRNGHTLFRFDITPYLSFSSPNLLTVKVDNSYFEDVTPVSGDYNFNGGIYRDVNLPDGRLSNRNISVPN